MDHFHLGKQPGSGWDGASSQMPSLVSSKEQDAPPERALALQEQVPLARRASLWADFGQVCSILLNPTAMNTESKSQLSSREENGANQYV